MEINKIYNEDCLETMKRMENDFVDLTITSPPYNTGGQNAQTGRNRKVYNDFKDNLSNEEYYNFIKNNINELLRVTKHYIFFNFQCLTNNKEIYYKIIGEFSDKIKDVFIWKKQAVSQIVKGKMATGYEFVIILSKNDNKMSFEYNNFPENNYVPNIKKFIKKEYFHNYNNATMPLKLAEYFILNFSKNNDLIYDCFSGMGTTACASIKNDRNFIGSEISKEYIDLSNKRLVPYLIQTKLF
tara:strand:- start:169 stop:891 length:723 start_codon:yes stop_codon:yes gene_type:complete